MKMLLLAKGQLLGSKAEGKVLLSTPGCLSLTAMTLERGLPHHCYTLHAAPTWLQCQ